MSADYWVWGFHYIEQNIFITPWLKWYWIQQGVIVPQKKEVCIQSDIPFVPNTNNWFIYGTKCIRNKKSIIGNLEYCQDYLHTFVTIVTDHALWTKSITGSHDMKLEHACHQVYVNLLTFY